MLQQLVVHTFEPLTIACIPEQPFNSCAGGAGYAMYRWRLKSYMNEEVRNIMAQYMPLEGGDPENNKNAVSAASAASAIQVASPPPMLSDIQSGAWTNAAVAFQQQQQQTMPMMPRNLYITPTAYHPDENNL